MKNHVLPSAKNNLVGFHHDMYIDLENVKAIMTKGDLMYCANKGIASKE